MMKGSLSIIAAVGILNAFLIGCSQDRSAPAERSAQGKRFLYEKSGDTGWDSKLRDPADIAESNPPPHQKPESECDCRNGEGAREEFAEQDSITVIFENGFLDGRKLAVRLNSDTIYYKLNETAPDWGRSLDEIVLTGRGVVRIYTGDRHILNAELPMRRAIRHKRLFRIDYGDQSIEFNAAGCNPIYLVRSAVISDEYGTASSDTAAHIPLKLRDPRELRVVCVHERPGYM